MMFIPVERMLMRWLTPITFSPCSRLASYCMRLSSTQHPSSSPSDMVSLPTRSHNLTSHAYESALTQPPPSQLWPQQTRGHFHKMATSFAIRVYSMSPTIRMSDWTSFAPTTTIAWLDILASPRRSRTSIVSSIGPEWSPLSPTTSTHVQSAVAASPSTTSHLALIDSSQSVNDLGTQSRWTSLRGCPCRMGMMCHLGGSVPSNQDGSVHSHLLGH